MSTWLSGYLAFNKVKLELSSLLKTAVITHIYPVSVSKNSTYNIIMPNRKFSQKSLFRTSSSMYKLYLWKWTISYNYVCCATLSVSPRGALYVLSTGYLNFLRKCHVLHEFNRSGLIFTYYIKSKYILWYNTTNVRQYGINILFVIGTFWNVLFSTYSDCFRKIAVATLLKHIFRNYPVLNE